MAVKVELFCFQVNNNKKKNLEDEKNFVTRAFGMANISNNATENLEVSQSVPLENLRFVFYNSKIIDLGSSQFDLQYLMLYLYINPDAVIANLIYWPIQLSVSN